MWNPLRRLRQRLPLHLAVQDLDDEIRLHLELRAEALASEGLPAAEALRRARLEFGAPERVKEECRDVRAGRLLREIRGRHALRVARGAPQSRPEHDDPGDDHAGHRRHRDRLRGFQCRGAQPGTLPGPRSTGVALGHQRATRHRRRAGAKGRFADGTRLAAMARPVRPVRGRSPPLRSTTPLTWEAHTASRRPMRDPNAEPAKAALVSPSFFEIAGVRPGLGRIFGPREPAVLLQHAYWRSRFQSRREIVGNKVWQGYGVRGQSRELLVAGVMPREFAVLTRSVDYLLPFDVDEFAKGQFGEDRLLAAIGRPQAASRSRRPRNVPMRSPGRWRSATLAAPGATACSSSRSPTTLRASSGPSCSRCSALSSCWCWSSR